MKNKIILLIFFHPFLLFAEKIKNPLENSGVLDLEGLIRVIVEGVTFLAIPIIVLAFVYSGFKFISAQGDTNKISDSRRLFLYTLAGSFIILATNLILEVVISTSEELFVLI